MRKSDTVSYTKGDTAIAIFNEFPGNMSPFATDGQLWRSRRRIVAPIFAVKRFDAQVSSAMYDIMTIAKDMLLVAADQKLSFDWNNFSGRLALAVLYRMSFGMDPGTITSDPECLDKHDRLVRAMNTCNTISSGRLYNPAWKITDWFTGTRKRFINARTELWEIADSVIHERRTNYLDSKSSGGDFLASLLDSGLSDTDIRDAIVTLFFAGHDNFLNVLGWSLHELSRAPEWLNRMRKEAQSTNSQGSVIGYADISKLPVHLAVFYETLRLWPGVPKNARYASEDDTLPAIPELSLNEVKVHRGEYLLWSDRCMMRSELVWGPSSGTFNPGRHLNDDGSFVKPSSPKFHSFGMGPRLCPGAQLGTYEFVAVWSTLLPYLDIWALRNHTYSS
ncbi:cytochrome P450 [Pyrrhoderma noxium]|uniref:Cytochrome P450 n=1 Tax=Pyrrhoderma noxium TaxID=2282107 RepID=A0A286U4X4_9AGAM|nr:cytochrome P450 [Pyrrhoderma noxium]